MVSAGLLDRLLLLPPPAAQPATIAAAPVPPVPLDAWLRIGTDDSITVLVDRSEMGQGVATALPMLLAEELEADWSRISIEFAPAAEVYFNSDFGSQGTGGQQQRARGLHAAAPGGRRGPRGAHLGGRRRSGRWTAPSAAPSRAPWSTRRATGGCTYGELAAAAAKLPLPKDVPLKDAKDWKVIGTPARRLDTPAKVDGSAVFGLDVRVPGMLVAVVARPPAFGGKVASFDATKAKAIPGVRDVVQISSGRGGGGRRLLAGAPGTRRRWR